MKNQDNKTIYPLQKDIETIDGIINAFYDIVSGPAGQPRQWERDNSLHIPKALISYTGKDRVGKSYIKSMNLDEFHSDTEPYEYGFWETEIGREVKQFGNIAHVWSAYETKRGDGTNSRGINTIQLYNDGNRWWITSWMFDSESPENLIENK